MELLEEFPVGLTFEMGLEDEVGVHQPDRKVRQICVLEKKHMHSCRAGKSSGNVFVIEV